MERLDVVFSEIVSGDLSEEELAAEDFVVPTELIREAFKRF